MAALSELLHPLLRDGRIGPAHISLYLAILQCKERVDKEMPFLIRREELMRLGKIRARTTYYRLLRDLDQWGHIEYWPSYKSAGKSKVFIPRTPFDLRI
jgi:hypothetical protein